MKQLSDVVLISIEGNIGSGKTTILRELQKTYPEWTFVNEPVDNWLGLKNDDGQSLLELFYNDKRRWSYTFQSVAVLHRFKNLMNALAARTPGKPTVIIMERSVFTDRMVFARMLHSQGLIDNLEWNIYLQWFEHIDSMLPHMDGYIYINTDSKLCVERIHKRHREGESEIPHSYIASLEEYHKSWLFKPEEEKNVFSYDNNTDDTYKLETIKNFVDELCSKKNMTF